MDIQTTVLNLIDRALGDLIAMGGKGSGNWGHKGRPGKRGGSAPKGSAAAIKKTPPTDSAFSEDQVYERNFTKGQLTRIRKEAKILPQEHLDTVSTIDQDYIGEGYAAECTRHNSIIMARVGDSAQWRAGDLTHEIGHAVSNHKKRYRIIGALDKPHRVFNRFYRDLAEKAGFNNSRAMEKHYVRRGIKSKFYKGFPSRYAMSHSNELFAESYMMYVRSPRTLSKRNPDIYSYMRDEVFEGIEYTK